MKKILLFSTLLLSACGTDKPEQTEAFAAHTVEIDKTEVCDNLDASVKETMTDAAMLELCNVKPVCVDFEVELDCTGEWCITHRTCRLK